MFDFSCRFLALRKYGRNDAVFFYNKGVEVDFYIPEKQLAIQVCYSSSDTETYKREITALLQMTKHIEVEKMLVITRDEERVIEENGVSIEVVPAWKWIFY